MSAQHTPPRYGPNNPPRLRKPSESVEQYRIAMGWDQPASAQHTPGRQCVECEGHCLRTATIDEANTALAIAGTHQERLLACEALIAAAEAEVQRLRAAIARATGSPA